VELLSIIINIVKHNSTLIEENTLVTLIDVVCSISNEANSLATIDLSLKVIDALVRKAEIRECF
jgi:hypothetical protein